MIDLISDSSMFSDSLFTFHFSLFTFHFHFGRSGSGVKMADSSYMLGLNRDEIIVNGVNVRLTRDKIPLYREFIMNLHG